MDLQLPGIAEEQFSLHDFRQFAGPIAQGYELSRAPVAFIVGPTGGGKSQAGARKILRAALRQHPSPRDGVRKVRICVVAPTYRVLWDTVLRSYLKVWPRSFGEFRGAHGDPADHTFDVDLGAGGRIHVEMLFRAIREQSVEDFVRGFEVTGWWIPEADTNPAADLVSLTSNRVGRYPEPDDRWDPEEVAAKGWEPAWRGVYGDANAPVIGSWFHTLLYHNRPEGWELWRQPAGVLPDGKVNPRAENLQNLRKIDADYYPNLIRNMEPYDVRRLIMCKPGYGRHGQPVHELFDDQAMISPVELEADASTDLVIGVDAGNTLKPAAIFKQRAWSGQHRILAELTCGASQMDILECGREIRRIKDTRFRHVQRAVIVVDPSAGARSAANRAMSYAQMLQGASGIEVQLAPTNDPLKRRTAVDQVMRKNCGPGEPGLLIDPRCTAIIAAYSGGYRFRKIGDKLSPIPEKNDHSHPADADQYATLYLEGEGLASGSLIAPPGGAGHPDDDRAILAG